MVKDESKEANGPEEALTEGEPRYSYYPYTVRRLDKNNNVVTRTYIKKYRLKRPLIKQPRKKKKSVYNPKYYVRKPLTVARLNLKKIENDPNKLNQVNIFINSLVDAQPVTPVH
jgi:hypothetical protein